MPTLLQCPKCERLYEVEGDKRPNCGSCLLDRATISPLRKVEVEPTRNLYHYLKTDAPDEVVFSLPALCGAKGWKIAGVKTEQVDCPSCLRILEAKGVA